MDVDKIVAIEQSTESPGDKQLDHDLNRDNALRRIHNQLKKTILKLVFSFSGIDPDIDDEITKLKNHLRHAANEDERRIIIERSVDMILKRASSLREGFTLAGNNIIDYFPEFLDRLSAAGEAYEELASIREQVKKRQSKQQYLEQIQKTVQLLCSRDDIDADINEQLINLLEQLVLPADTMPQLNSIRDQLSLNQVSSLKEVNKKISKVINGVHVRLQKELDDIQRYLNKLIAQLSALYRHLESVQREQGISCMDAEALNSGFREQNEKLHNEMEAVNNLDDMKACIDAHMVRIQTALDEHLTAERTRRDAAEERANELKTRLQQMETETLSLKEKLNQEHNNAHRDALTRVPNRLSYEEQLHKERTRCLRYQQPLTLALIDIDNFKAVNDQYGHKAGDKVLKAVATVCQENIRESDFLARYGGEEFVLLLPETDHDEAAVAVENLRRVVESCNFYHRNQSVPVTISIGYAELKLNESTEDLFHRADMALYSAKGSGRNKCISDTQASSAA